MVVCLSRGSVISAQQEHSGITYLECDADLLSDVEALSHDGELVELEVVGHVRHSVGEAMHEPSRAARRAAMRFEAEGVELGAPIRPALFIVGSVGESTCDLSGCNVGGASGTDNGDVEGDSARLSEVVDDDVARASVVSCD